MPQEYISRWLERPLKSLSVTEVPELGATVGTTIGEVRSENQDRAIVARYTTPRASDRSFLCFMICDGMGGMAEGARCAEIATASFLSGLVHIAGNSFESRVRSAALAANRSVHDRYRERGGTTLTGIVGFTREVWAINIGDSRIYELSGNKELRQVTTDDTIAGELDRLKGLTEPRSTSDTFATQLAQYVGIGNEIEPRVVRINSEAAYLLTSDGVHGYGMHASMLKQIAIAARSPVQLVSRLLNLSRWCGGIDNASAISVSAVRSEFLVPPAWSREDRLEIWDSGGKLELPIGPVTAPSVGSISNQVSAPIVEPQTRRSRKNRPKASSLEQAKRAPTQGTLKIEILDEPPREESSVPLNPESDASDREKPVEGQTNRTQHDPKAQKSEPDSEGTNEVKLDLRTGTGKPQSERE